MNGKTKPTKKKLSQFTDPEMMNAAGREDCVNSSVVRMLVTPPAKKGKKYQTVEIKKRKKLQHFPNKSHTWSEAKTQDKSKNTGHAQVWKNRTNILLEKESH